MKIVKEILPYMFIIIIVIILRTFVVTPAQVIGSSMEPTLYNSEIIILNKIHYKLSNIKRFDIVVIKMDNEKALIKRVIGLPGEKVEYKDNKLYINGEYVPEDMTLNDETYDYILNYDKIPANKYFVMGDNRNNTLDSRIIGLIDEDNIVGKTNFVFFPLTKIRTVK
ncbi:MAG: signal peptidase I [Bacilli bacterium]|nr:signal peptidase I [Bacilli bacterium]